MNPYSVLTKHLSSFFFSLEIHLDSRDWDLMYERKDWEYRIEWWLLSNDLRYVRRVKLRRIQRGMKEKVVRNHCRLVVEQRRHVRGMGSQEPMEMETRIRRPTYDEIWSRLVLLLYGRELNMGWHGRLGMNPFHHQSLFRSVWQRWSVCKRIGGEVDYLYV